MDRPSLPAVDVCVCVCVATSLVEILVMPSVERKGEEGRVRKEEGRKLKEFCLQTAFTYPFQLALS